MVSTKSQVAKWGNSLAVRIPKQVAEQAALREGDHLLFEVKSAGEFKVKAVKRPPSLSELVARITSQNLHGEEEWGGSVGNEAW